jgi:two-component system, OmpR family, response regulator
MTAPILIVEDDPDIRYIMCAALGDAGHQVEAAGDGRAALESAIRRAPALVVLDWHLPELPGEAVAAGLRALYGDGLPILLVSATHGVGRIARRTGAFGYLSKPFSLAALLDGVEEGLARASQADADAGPGDRNLLPADTDGR